MRRVLAGAALTTALAAAPAWGATSEVKVENFEFIPANVTIDLNDRVTWRFTGFDTNHSVTSDPGQADSFDSDPGNDSPVHQPGYTFSHDFRKAGSFTYYCKVHPSMRGTVNVRGPGGGGAPDTTAPAVGALSAKGGRKCRKRARKCRKRKTRISFTLSEAAQVRLRFKRRRGKSPKAVVRQLAAGAQTLRFSTRRVPRGRYRLTVVATDAAGNRSAAKRRSFRVR